MSQIYAIIATGGKQYKVAEGDVLKVEKLGAAAGETVTFDQVIAVSNDGLKVGADVAGATVTATVVGEGKGKKVIVYIGHAGYADAGSDIICAAVSVLVFNTLNAIESYTDDTMNVVTNDEAGLVDVVFESPVSDRAKLLLDTMILGLTGIEKQYGKKFLRLKFEEV